MVFVFNKSTYTPSSSAATKKAHFRVVLMLTIFVLAYVLIGATIFLFINPEYAGQGIAGLQDNNFLDSVYFMTVTLTTVGYGDVVPANDEAKLFLIAYILLALVATGILLEVTDFFYEIDVEEIEDAVEPVDGRWLTAARKRFLYALGFVFLMMLVSTLFYVKVENYRVVDAIYFSVATITTVGYGDFAPKDNAGKIFAIFFMIIGTVAMFHAVGTLIDLILESRKRKWKRHREDRSEVLRRHISVRLQSTQMVDIPETEVIQKYSKQELIDTLTRMEFYLYRLEKDGLVEASDIKKLETAFKAMTPEEIKQEFHEQLDSSYVFGSHAPKPTPKVSIATSPPQDGDGDENV